MADNHVSEPVGAASACGRVTAPCRSEYDSGVNTFSPEGRLFQIEYAMGAIKVGCAPCAMAA